MWRQARCAGAKRLQAHVGAMSLLSPGDKHMPGDDLPSPVTSFSIALVGLWIRDIIGKPSHTKSHKERKGIQRNIDSSVVMNVSNSVQASTSQHGNN